MKSEADSKDNNRKPRRPAESGLKVFIDPKIPLALGDKDRTAAKNSGSQETQDAYKEYEASCAQTRTENATLLDGFGRMLRDQRLAPRTISQHQANVEFFIDEFLLETDATRRPADGLDEIEEFLGDWLIRKALWSTPRSIKSSATSLYKFYAFLTASGMVKVEALAQLKHTIAQQLPEWQARCARYNDGVIDDWRGMD